VTIYISLRYIAIAMSLVFSFSISNTEIMRVNYKTWQNNSLQSPNNLITTTVRHSRTKSKGIKTKAFIDQPRCGGTSYIRSYLSVCQTITFGSLNVRSSYLHIQYISPGNMGQVRIWKSLGRGQGQGHRSIKGRKIPIPAMYNFHRQ